jgi:cytochrome P450 enzyme
MREHEPIYYWSKRDALVVTRFEDLKSMLTDPRLSTDSREWEHHPGAAMFERPGFETWARLVGKSLFVVPHKEHARLRRLARSAFIPRAVRTMDAMVSAAVHESLERVLAAGGEVVNIRDFAEAIPMKVIGDLLGVPPEHRPEFRRFGEAALQFILPNNDPERFQVLRMAREGARVVAADVGDALATLTDELGSAPGSLAVLRTDITRQADVGVPS